MNALSQAEQDAITMGKVRNVIYGLIGVAACLIVAVCLIAY